MAIFCVESEERKWRKGEEKEEEGEGEEVKDFEERKEEAEGGFGGKRWRDKAEGHVVLWCFSYCDVKEKSLRNEGWFIKYRFINEQDGNA